MMRSNYSAAMLLCLAFFMASAPARANSSDAAGEGVMFVILTDNSKSISLAERRLYSGYLKDRVLPLVGPGDSFIMGEIGANASTSFREQIRVELPGASYQSAPVMSLAYFEEQADESEAKCVGEYRKSEEQLRSEVERKAQAELENPSTAEKTCLVDTVNDVADTFAAYSGAKVLLIFSDGIEDCGKVRFERSISVAETLDSLQSEGRIPDLRGVRVLFMRRSDQTVPHVMDQTKFWKQFFRLAKAQSIQIDPQGDFNFGLGPRATIQQRCGDAD